jgi:hypothetical protein
MAISKVTKDLRIMTAARIRKQANGKMFPTSSTVLFSVSVLKLSHAIFPRVQRFLLMENYTTAHGKQRTASVAAN